MALKIKNQTNAADLVELKETTGDVRVEVNGKTILYLHANGKAFFYPTDDNSSIEGKWDK